MWVSIVYCLILFAFSFFIQFLGVMQQGGAFICITIGISMVPFLSVVCWGVRCGIFDRKKGFWNVPLILGCVVGSFFVEIICLLADWKISTIFKMDFYVLYQIFYVAYKIIRESIRTYKKTSKKEERMEEM